MGKKFTLLDIVDEFYGKKNKLENTLLIASQHLLWTQLEMFKRLLARNLEAKDTYIIWKNYSTNKEVYDVLYKEWLYIDPASREFEYNENFDNRFDNKIGRLLDKVEKEQQLQGKKIILLDDWWHLIHTAQEKGRNEKYNVLWIEQTSSWYNKIKDTELDFVNVARSNTKITYETPYIGDLCIKRIMESIEKNKIIHPNCLVVWCWPIGEAIVLRCKKMWIPCTWFDNTQKQVKTLTQICNMDVSEKHFMDFYQEKIKDFNIIIWATGSNILNFNQLKDLWSKVLLMSASSSDREFPSMEIRRHADSKFEIHEDREYKNVVLVNSWFPITFHGNYHEVSQKTIELTIALLYWWVLYQSFKDQRNSEGQPLNIINSRLLEWFKKRV